MFVRQKGGITSLMKLHYQRKEDAMTNLLHFLWSDSDYVCKRVEETVKEY